MTKQELTKILAGILFLVFSSIAFAEELNQTNQTFEQNITINQTEQANYTLDNTTILLNMTTLENNTVVNTTIEPITSFTMYDFIPKKFKKGDTQFNIQVKNTGNTLLKNIYALVTGEGFATYEVTPIDELKPGEKSYIIVMGTFLTEGNKTLDININGEKFKQKIIVVSDQEIVEPENEINQTLIQEQALKKKQELQNLSTHLNVLKSNYTQLESELQKKEDENYDTSDITISEMKALLAKAESSILLEAPDQARANLALAKDEYLYQKQKLDKAEKKSIMFLIKDNLVLFSAIAGSIITLFAFIELMKKKQESVQQTIKSTELDKKLKTFFEKKQKEDKKQTQSETNPNNNDEPKAPTP